MAKIFVPKQQILDAYKGWVKREYDMFVQFITKNGEKKFSKIQYEEMEKAFFAGHISMIREIEKLSDAYPEDFGAEILSVIDADLKSFFDKIKAESEKPHATVH